MVIGSVSKQIVQKISSFATNCDIGTKFLNKKYWWILRGN